MLETFLSANLTSTPTSLKGVEAPVVPLISWFRIKELLFETKFNGNSKLWWEKRGSGKSRHRQRNSKIRKHLNCLS